jgi:hypothetical protein
MRNYFARLVYPTWCRQAFTRCRAQRSSSLHRRSAGVLVALALFFVPSPARADSSSPEAGSTEVTAFFGLGVTSLDTGGGPAFRFGGSAAHWLNPWFGVGGEFLGFNNIVSLATDSLACQPGQPCYSGDPRNRSGWVFEPRLSFGTMLWVVRLYAAVGAGLAHEDVPVTPSQSYYAAAGVLEVGANFHISNFSLVPALRFDDIDGSLSSLLQLGLGANF